MPARPAASAVGLRIATTVASRAHDRNDRNAVHPAFEEPTPRRAANDDRESVGTILRALQRRPSKTPFIVAWLFTACWAVFFAGMVFGTYSDRNRRDDEPRQLAAHRCRTDRRLLCADCIVLFLAAMLARAQELRLVSQTMAEIALRLR